MRLLIQRVSSAHVAVDNQVVGNIGAGLVAFVGIRHDDTPARATQLARKLTRLRLFSDTEGKMNLSLLDTGGALLIISQFTLYAETKRQRPSFSLAASADVAVELYKLFVAECEASGIPVATGIFRAHMVVTIVNDGPVTVICDSE